MLQVSAVKNNVAKPTLSLGLVIRNSSYVCMRGRRSRLQRSAKQRLLLRFGDNAAGNAVAGVARRIGFHVVGFCMNHQSRSAITENRMVVAAHCCSLCDNGTLHLA